MKNYCRVCNENVVFELTTCGPWLLKLRVKIVYFLFFFVLIHAGAPSVKYFAHWPSKYYYYYYYYYYCRLTYNVNQGLISKCPGVETMSTDHEYGHTWKISSELGLIYFYSIPTLSGFTFFLTPWHAVWSYKCHLEVRHLLRR